MLFSPFRRERDSASDAGPGWIIPGIEDIGQTVFDREEWMRRQLRLMRRRREVERGCLHPVDPARHCDQCEADGFCDCLECRDHA